MKPRNPKAIPIPNKSADNGAMTLPPIGCLQADQARARIQQAQRHAADIRRDIDALQTATLPYDPAHAALNDKWFRWREMRRDVLNRDLALARAELEVIVKSSGRAIAREEALGLMIAKARETRRKEQRAKALETQSLTFPGARYP